MNDIEKAMKEYFGKIDGERSTASTVDFSRNIYQKPKPTAIMHEVQGTNTWRNGYRLLADGNIDDLENFANILKKLCNAAWGEGWGELSPDLKTGEDSASVILPQITVEMNTREPAEGMGGLKPRLVDIINEEDGNGNLTGDAFLLYRQWFDCNVEFNFYGRNSKETRELQKKFETLITVYAGYLKRNGISEIVFEQEVSGKCSLNFVETRPMRCIYYYVRLESITPVRQSLINEINMKIGASQLDVDKVKAAVTNGLGVNDFEIDFFDGDTGITYNQDN